MTLVEDDARSTTMRHPHLYARTSWPCFKVTGLLATSHSPSAFVKRSPMWSCSGKMATDSADEGRLRFGHSPGDPVSLILARPDVHRVIVRAVLRAVQTLNCVLHLPSQHLLVAHEIRRAVLGARSVRWLRLRDPIHHRSVQTAKLLVVGRS